VRAPLAPILLDERLEMPVCLLDGAHPTSCGAPGPALPLLRGCSSGATSGCVAVRGWLDLLVLAPYAVSSASTTRHRARRCRRRALRGRRDYHSGRHVLETDGSDGEEQENRNEVMLSGWHGMRSVEWMRSAEAMALSPRRWG